MPLSQKIIGPDLEWSVYSMPRSSVHIPLEKMQFFWCERQGCYVLPGTERTGPIQARAFLQSDIRPAIDRTAPIKETVVNRSPATPLDPRP